MKKIFEPYAIKALGAVRKIIATTNVFPTVMTEQHDIRSLLSKLYPVSCDEGLIRLGPKGDGGYLVPKDLAGIESCFSPGVSTVSGFEKDCADLGMKVFLADKSVEQPTEEHKQFSFIKKFVGAISNDDFMTLDDWVASSLPESLQDLILQMDIEGAEYEVFLSTSDVLMRRFRIIVVEFHKLDELWNKPFFNIAARTFEKILQTHTCVHIHPNNSCSTLKINGLDIPPVSEFTFFRNDCITNPTYQIVFPSPLDHDNTEKKPLILPKCWYA